MYYSYLWSVLCTFIQQINLSSMVNDIEWINAIYKICCHYGKKIYWFSYSDLTAEPAELLIKHHLSTF